MTHPTDLNTWNYNVHVYPKNKKVDNPDQPTKTVNDANTIAGDTIKYQASAPVQAYKTLTQFLARDFYPADRLENGEVANVTIQGTKAGQAASAELVAGTDYTVTDDNQGNLDTVLTAAGIEKLNGFEANAQRKVVVDLTFTVKKLDAEAAAPIENKFGVTQNNTGTPGDKPTPPTPPGETPPGETPPGDTPNWPRSYYGDVKITKTGKDDKALKGVTFDLYRCNSEAELADTALLKNITTRPDGTAVVRGLQANNWVNNKEWSLTEKEQNDPRAYLAYCLVETKTAPGHELLAQPIKFQVVANDTTKTVALVDQQISNIPSNGGFDLPLTGGQGVIYLLAGGVMLLVLAGGAYYIMRRREA